MKRLQTKITTILLTWLCLLLTLPALADEAKRYVLRVTAQPTRAGSFNTNQEQLADGETIHLFAYANSKFKFKEWKDETGKVISSAQDIIYTMPAKDKTLTAVYTFNPDNPSNPSKNDWDKNTGNIIVDDFQAGNLSKAITEALNGSSTNEVMTITVAGQMNDNDFGVANNYSNCSLLDISRVAGITIVPSYAFDYTNIESVYLPASIEKIGYRAFYQCKRLSTITIYALTPPTLEAQALTGTQSDLIVFVPSAAISQYREAEGWKNYTLLPIQEDIRSLSVNLPENTDGNTYKEMYLELTNTKSGQKMHYVMTNRTSYTFNNIIRNTSWNVAIRNERDDVFGEINDITVADEDVSVTFPSLEKPQQVRLKVITPEGDDVTSKTQVTWTYCNGKYLSQSHNLNGLLAGSQLNYQIALPQQLAITYSTPGQIKYEVKKMGNDIEHLLTLIPQTVISGTVKSASDNYPLSGAVVSASQTFCGQYSKTQSVKTDRMGRYKITAANVPTSLVISASDFISQTLVCDSLMNGNEEIKVADIALKPISGAILSLNLTYTKCTTKAEGENTQQNWYSDYNNIAYTIYNQTKHKAISQFNVQYPQIVLLEEVAEGDVLTITATSKNNTFNPVITTAIINAEQQATAHINIVELGKIQASYKQNNNASVVGSLYDADGKLLKTYNYANTILTISDLVDGKYTLVSMGSSQLFNTIYDLSQLPQTGLVEGTDYVQNCVEVKSGLVSAININTVPTFDESKLYYTGDNTSFSVNKPSIVAGNYLTLTGRIDFKPAYATCVSNVQMIIDLPESCDFVENSVMVGNSISSYMLNNHQITIPMAHYTDRVRFCIIPTLGGEYAPSGFVQFELNGETIKQPIGSANYTAKDLSIYVPSTVAKTAIPVSGTAIGTSNVEIYDNDVLIGQTTSLANGTWATTCELNEPYNLSTHNIFAKVTTKNGIRLVSENVNCLYNKNAIEVKTVTMINTAHTSANLDLHDYVTIFDFQNPKQSYPAYWYWPSYPDFTFLVDFTNNDTTIVKDVVLYVFTDHNDLVTLYPEYDAKKNIFVATAKFDSYSLPYNVSVDFNAVVQQTIDAKKLSDSKQNIISIANDFWNTKKIIDNFYDEHNHATSEDYFSLCKQLGLPIDSDELLPIETTLPEGVTEDNIEEYLDKVEIIFEEEFARISEDVHKFSNIFQLSDKYKLNLESGYQFTLENADGVTEDYLHEKGYSQYQLSNGGKIFIKTSEEYSTYVNLQESTIITIKIPVNELPKFSEKRKAPLTDDFNEVFEKLETAKLLVKTINEDFQKRIMLPVKVQEKNIKKLESDIKNIKRYITCMCKEGSNKQKFWIKRLKDAEYTLSVAKTSLKLSGPLLRTLARSIPVLDYLATISDCYSIAEELRDIYQSIPEPCTEDQTKANWCKAEDITILVATGMFAIADVVAEVTADVDILSGAAAAVTTGGASLAVSGWGIVQKALAELGKYTLTTATKHFAIKELKKRVRELNCNSSDSNPNPPSPPGGGAPNVKDPSGYVYEGITSNRIEGVTATIYFKEMVEDMYGDLHENITKWDASKYAQENPLFTDKYGMYAWDVPNGLWQVKFEKEGYETTYSEWLPVPPPQLDVNIAMKQNRQPEVKIAHAYNDAIEVEFDKYMMPELLTTENIIVLQNGNTVEGTVELLNEEATIEGSEVTFASKIRFNAAQPFTEQEVTLLVNNRVKSYAGIRMQDNYQQTFTIEQEIKQIVRDSVVTVGYGDTSAIIVSVLPTSASKGKTLTVKSSSPMILGVETKQVTIDNDGKAEIIVSGELPGTAALTFSVEGTDKTATTIANVGQIAIKTVTTPKSNVASGSMVEKGTAITLSCETAGATIYYTLDGSCPCENTDARKVYDGNPIIINENVTIKAIAMAPNMYESDVAEFTYIVDATGINDLNVNDQIQIYPLPIKDKVNIFAGEKIIKSVTISSMNGIVVASISTPTRKVTLDVSSVATGLYIINLQTEDNTYSRKVLIVQ